MNSKYKTKLARKAMKNIRHTLVGTALVGLIGASGSAVAFNNMQVFSTPGTHTITLPAGDVQIEVRGAGGGGGSGNGSAVGQGGSGGGYGQEIFTIAAGTYDVVVGDGGAGAPFGTTCSVGTAGGASSFDSTLISATGGGGGGGCGSSSTPGNSAAELAMEGFEGIQRSSTFGRNSGGASGDGSSVGSGGEGAQLLGRDGQDGNVIVRW